MIKTRGKKFKSQFLRLNRTLVKTEEKLTIIDSSFADLERKENSEDGERNKSNPNFKHCQPKPAKQLAKLEKHPYWLEVLAVLTKSVLVRSPCRLD